jgi:hypothetical protein
MPEATADLTVFARGPSGNVTQVHRGGCNWALPKMGSAAKAANEHCALIDFDWASAMTARVDSLFAS